MDSNQQKGSLGARIAWAAVTPIALALAAFSLAGIVFIPALCLYLDGRSRTYTAAAVVLVAAIALPLIFGLAMASVTAFIAVATAAAYVLKRVRQPFQIGLAGSAAGGVLGAVAMLGILGTALGRPVGEIATDWLLNALSGLKGAFGSVYNDMLSVLAWQVQNLQNGNPQDLLSMIGTMPPPQILHMSVVEKAGIVRPYLEQSVSRSLPGTALVVGMLTGGLGYYLPVMALSSRRRWLAGFSGTGIDVPPFAAFKLPKYVVISIFLLMIGTSFVTEGDTILTLNSASTTLFEALMTLQALGLLSYLLNRKKVYGGFQVLILGSALLLFSCLMPWVGFFDALFDVRSVMARLESLKAKGKQVFTQGGLDELRRMDRSGKKDDNDKSDKNGKDGEDGEK